MTPRLSQSLRTLTSALLTFGLVAGALLSLGTAFGLPVDSSALLLMLATCSLGFVAMTHCHGSWRALIWMALALVAFLGFRYRWQLLYGLQELYSTLRHYYCMAYSNLWLPEWSPPAPADATAAFGALGLLLTLVTALAIHQRLPVILALLIDAIPLGLCFVVTDTPPSGLWLTIFLTAAGATLLSQSSRTQERGGVKLTWIALPVTLSLLLVLQSLLPMTTTGRSDFGNQASSWLVNRFNRLSALDFTGLFQRLEVQVPVTGIQELWIHPPNQSDRTLLEVRTAQEQFLYLRGMTYGTYTGTTWETLAPEVYDQTDTKDSFTLKKSQDLQTLSLRTTYTESVLYTPYYLQTLPQTGQHYDDICIENTDDLKEYQLTYYTQINVDLTRYGVTPSTTKAGEYFITQRNTHTDSTTTETFTGGTHVYSPELTSYALISMSPYDKLVYDQYLQLPSETRQELVKRMPRLGLDLEQLQQMPTSEAAAAIESAVRQWATYDLQTPRMPQGRDFVLWFLEESDTGYCVHFASAATTLLRAAGIPARYVTGYLVSTQENQWTQVSQRHSHAWAEYYVAGIGWIPLEATPAGGTQSTAHGGQDPEPETTAPPETTEATQATESTQTTPETTEATEAPSNQADPTQTSSTDPQPSHNPGTEPTEPPEQPITIEIPAWVWWTLLGIGAFFCWRPLVLALRRRKARRLEPRKRFLWKWRRLCRYAELLKQPLAHEDLAQAALFGRNPPDQVAFDSLSTWQQILRQHLATRSPFVRFFFHWVLPL